MQNLAVELEREQAYVDMLYRRLDTLRERTQAELDRAFDDFYTTKPDGTGLGLSIVRRLILDLNGTLRVQTTPGTGTRISVELPASPTESGR